MISILLPDGSTRKFDKPITGLELAKDIAPSLEKNALVLEVNGKLKDLSYKIKKNANVTIPARIIIIARSVTNASWGNCKGLILSIISKRPPVMADDSSLLD